MFSRQWPSKRAHHRRQKLRQQQQHHHRRQRNSSSPAPRRASSKARAAAAAAAGGDGTTGLATTTTTITTGVPTCSTSSTSSFVMIAIIFYALLLYEGSAEIDHSGKYKSVPQYLQPEWKPGSGPGFDTSAPTNVTGLVGTSARLLCRVKNLGNRTVSWIRHRDIHLLTVNRYTYTSDQRFEAMHQDYTDDWALRIRYPQAKDSGIYECQISTTPPIGHKVYLTVVEPITEIAGGGDLFINKGSTINLTCLVKNAPKPPDAMIWSHNQQPINFDSPRGGISLVTEKGPVTTSRLLIQKAIQKDSGLYTCAPTNGHPNSVRVHILNEHPAAMHHGGGDRMAGRLVLVVILVRMIF